MVEINKNLLDTVKKFINIQTWGDEFNPFDTYEKTICLNDKFFKFKPYALSPWEEDDKGKYSYATETFQLYEIIPSTSQKNKWTFKEPYNLFAIVPSMRTGSYYCDYMYTYEYPILRKQVVKHIPEVVIPAHDEINFEDINEENTDD